MQGKADDDHLAYINRVRTTDRWQVFQDYPDYRRSISDQKYGGPAGSLQVALAYRNDHLDEVAPDAENVRYEQVLDRDALTSIVSGVYYIETSKGPYFQTQWKEDGTKKCRKRSISYHGRKEALRQIAQLRYEAKESDMDGVSWQAFWKEAKARFL